MILTANAIRQLQDNHVDGYAPVVQIVEAKDSQNLRVRGLISDGKEACPCVINRDQNAPIKEFYCIKIMDSVLNRIAGRPTPLLTILRYSIVDTKQTGIIGSPSIQGSSSSSSSNNNSRGAQSSNNQQHQQQQQQQYRPGNPRAPPQEASINPRDVMPISELNPYSNKWVIKARVTSKGPLKEWKSKATGKGGELFAVDLLDNHKGEIRATAYNSTAQKLFNMMHEGCVYYISNGKLKHADKRFSTLNNEYEITLEESSIVQPAESDDSSIPLGNYSFLTIEEIQQRGSNAVVDLVGIVEDVGSCDPFRTKKGNDTFKRTVKLNDGEGTVMRSIELTLWGSHAENCNWQKGDCVCIKSVRTSDFHGVTLNSIFSSQFVVNSNEIEASIALQHWYNELVQTGAPVQLVEVSNQQSANPNRAYRPVNYLTDISKFTLGIRPDGKPDFIMVKATVSFIKDTPLVYPACPNDDCKGKKVEKMEDYGNNGAQWFCQKCQNRYDAPNYRYIVSMKISDITGEQWVTAFNDSAGTVLNGYDANDLEELRNTDAESFQTILQDALFKQYTMKLRIQEENRMDPTDGSGTRIKVQLSQAYPINFVSESKRLLNLISKVA